MIGKPENPSGFKMLNRYYVIKVTVKCWMDSTLFEEWVHEFDGKFLKENKRIALKINYCDVHSAVGNVSNIRCILLLANATYASTLKSGSNLLKISILRDS